MRNRLLAFLMIFMLQVPAPCRLVEKPSDPVNLEPAPDTGDEGDIKGEDSSSTGTDGESADTESEPPPPAFDPLQVIMDYHGFNDAQKRHIIETHYQDPVGDWIYSIAAMIISQTMEDTDIMLATTLILMFGTDATLEYFGNTIYPCDSEIESGFVVCAVDSLPIEPGKVFMIVMKLAAEVPAADPDRFLTYSVLFDADGDPDNNFQYTDPYDWEYYQNTDRWYILGWDPDAGSWFLSVMDFASNSYPYPTAARAVVMGDIVVFFIPASEFSAEYPPYRLSTFGHDGSYLPEASCGDVSGANPTEDLWQINQEVIVIE